MKLKRFSIRLKFTILIFVLLAIFLMLSIVFIGNSQHSQAEHEILEKARILTVELKASWDFIDQNQTLINTDSNGKYEFKGLYCAIVGKSVGKLITKKTDYEIKYTSFTPRNNNDKPDAFELEALNAFEADESIEEYYKPENKNNRMVYRYATPLHLKKTCLECHGQPAGEIDITGYPKEGQKLGDIGGILSIAMPMEQYLKDIHANIEQQIFLIQFLFFLFAIAIYISFSHFINRPLKTMSLATSSIESGNYNFCASGIGDRDEIEDLAKHFEAMTNQLKTVYENLEKKVSLRTQELANANKVLKSQREVLEKANKKLAEENEYKSDFLTIISHDLKTPLTAIILFVNILSEDIPMDQRKSEALREIKENSQILLRMVNNILDIGRINAGRLKLNFETIDMVDIIESIETTFRLLAENKHLKFSANVSKNVPLVIADWETIRRIMENLVSNSIKFTPEGGSVEVDIKFDDKTSNLIIKVSDTGIGIEKPNLDRIFERFVRMDDHSFEHYRGTGLGLAIVSDFVSMYKGRIEVVSTTNKGSIFTIYLPVKARRGYS